MTVSVFNPSGMFIGTLSRLEQSFGFRATLPPTHLPAVTCFGEHYSIKNITLLICLIWPAVENPLWAGGGVDADAEYLLMLILFCILAGWEKTSLSEVIPLNGVTLLPRQHSLGD